MTRASWWPTAWGLLRLAMAVVTAAAIIAQAQVTIGGAVAAGRDVVTTVVNFFSFFTILSNVAAVLVLAWAAVWLFARGRAAASEPRFLALALASVTTYMLVTGVVYNVLLRGIALPQGTTVPWSNEVLHVVGPLFLLADLFLGAKRRALRWRAIAAILVFPIAWVAYTLVRGPLTTNPVTGDPWWYPYPFLDPHGFSTGYLAVAGYIVGIAIAITAFAALVVWVGRYRGSRAAALPSRRAGERAR